MPPNPLWPYFHHDKTKYKNDKTHLNAWCKACIKSQKRVLIELDASQVRSGEVPAVRSELDLELAGKFEHKAIKTRVRHSSDILT